MKADIDSVLYIIITIVILVISALSGRKKKKAQQMQAKGPQKRDEEIFEPVESETFVDRISNQVSQGSTSTSQKVQNQFDRLEQFITGQFPETQVMEDESYNVRDEPISMEGETLEEVVDEEELIMEEIRKSRETNYERVHEEKTLQKDFSHGIQEKKPTMVLFENVDEITKAIIYSEIINRKYT